MYKSKFYPEKEKHKLKISFSSKKIDIDNSTSEIDEENKINIPYTMKFRKIGLFEKLSNFHSFTKNSSLTSIFKNNNFLKKDENDINFNDINDISSENKINLCKITRNRRNNFAKRTVNDTQCLESNKFNLIERTIKKNKKRKKVTFSDIQIIKIKNYKKLNKINSYNKDNIYMNYSNFTKKKSFFDLILNVFN